MRFGLIGTGYWAEHNQGAALVAHPEVELVGVWGRDPVKAEGLASRLGTSGYADYDALLAEVEAVAFAIAPDAQADLAERAARAGRHLLLEKPLALTVDAADRVVAAVEESGVSSVIFFTNRFHPAIEAFLGEAARRSWDSARVTMLSSIFTPGSPFGASQWRHERGGLWDVGPHALSLLLPVLGPVERVQSELGPHATSHLLLRHTSGAVSTVALSLDSPTPYHEALFIGTDGVVAVPDRQGTSVDAAGRAISALIECVAAGQVHHPCDVRFGREVVTVLAQA